MSTSESSKEESSSSCDEKNFGNRKPSSKCSLVCNQPLKECQPEHLWVDNTSSIDESRIPLFQNSIKSNSSNINRKLLKWFLILSILILVGLVFVLYLTKKTFVGLDLIRNLANWSSTENVHPKHKLHYWLEEMKSSVSNIGITKTARQARNNSETTKKVTIISESNENSSTLVRDRLYDRLSILIDHDLFQNLNFKYLISNETFE